MRIDQTTLIKFADDLIQKRVKEASTILAVYLHGSVNEPVDHLLGESGDLDLVFVHEYEAAAKREFISITDDVTIDIANHTRVAYRAPRDLRTDPWLGSAVYDFRIMHDPRHFLDFVQAGVRDQFHRPSNVHARASLFAGSSRRRWLGLMANGEGQANSGLDYISALSEAAQAVACLAGPPLPERRLLSRYFERLDSIGQAAFYPELVALLGGDKADAADLEDWSAGWRETFLASAARETAPVEWGLRPERWRYYHGAFQEQLASERPSDALWPLLLTWTRAGVNLPTGAETRKTWEAAMQRIGLVGPGQAERLVALDAYLDRVEELIDAWGRARGLEV